MKTITWAVSGRSLVIGLALVEKKTVCNSWAQRTELPVKACTHLGTGWAARDVVGESLHGIEWLVTAPLLGNWVILMFESVHTHNQQRFEGCLPLFKKLKVSVLFFCWGFSCLCAETERLSLCHWLRYPHLEFEKLQPGVVCNKSRRPYCWRRAQSMPCTWRASYKTVLPVSFSASGFCWRASLSR